MKPPDITENSAVMGIIRRALEEDIGAGDVTTEALALKSEPAGAAILARGDYVVSGSKVAAAVFNCVDPELKCDVRIQDGKRVKNGETVMTVEGMAGGILAAERTALNFIQQMTGIATLTSRFVDKANRYGVTILDTRKTIPTLRILQKYAVLCGGGRNHRMGLYDRVLIKDNHRLLLYKNGACELDKAILCAKEKFPDVPIEVEVENDIELKNALKAKPNWILLDNMTPEDLRRSVEICAGQAHLEASGNITMENVEEVAETGVDAISLGCLTHSAPSADFSMEFRGRLNGAKA